MTKDIETVVRQCQMCQSVQSVPPVSPLHPWSWPTRPWTRLHLDCAGPIDGKMVLVLVDAHSKWIEAVWTPNATSATVIEELREQFARFGIPETLVTDNGTCFVSEEFEAFLRPVFKEDETTLIIIGAVLGGLAGLIQYFIFFY